MSSPDIRQRKGKGQQVQGTPKEKDAALLTEGAVIDRPTGGSAAKGSPAKQSPASAAKSPGSKQQKQPSLEGKAHAGKVAGGKPAASPAAASSSSAKQAAGGSAQKAAPLSAQGAAEDKRRKARKQQRKKAKRAAAAGSDGEESDDIASDASSEDAGSSGVGSSDDDDGGSSDGGSGSDSEYEQDDYKRLDGGKPFDYDAVIAAAPPQAADRDLAVAAAVGFLTCLAAGVLLARGGVPQEYVMGGAMGTLFVYILGLNFCGSLCGCFCRARMARMRGLSPIEQITPAMVGIVCGCIGAMLGGMFGGVLRVIRANGY